MIYNLAAIVLPENPFWFLFALLVAVGDREQKKAGVANVHPLGNLVRVWFLFFLCNFPITSFVDYFHYLYRWNLLPSSYNYHFLISVHHILACEPVI